MKMLRLDLKSENVTIKTLYLSPDELAHIEKIIPRSANSAKAALEAAKIRKAASNKSPVCKLPVTLTSVDMKPEGASEASEFFRLVSEGGNSR